LQDRTEILDYFPHLLAFWKMVVQTAGRGAAVCRSRFCNRSVIIINRWEDALSPWRPAVTLTFKKLTRSPVAASRYSLYVSSRLLKYSGDMVFTNLTFSACCDLDLW